MPLPYPQDSYNGTAMRVAFRQLETWDRQNFKRQQDIDLANGERIILTSPNGSKFALKVDNAGVVGTDPA